MRLLCFVLCLFGFVFMYAEEQAESKVTLPLMTEELLKTGLTPDKAEQLKQLGLPDLRNITLTYLSREKDGKRFSFFLGFLEKHEFGRQLLSGMYPRLFMGVEIPELRIRLCSSVVSVVPEKGIPFLTAELETAGDREKGPLLRLFAGYSSLNAYKTVLPYLADSSAGADAAFVLGMIGRKDAIPHLINVLGKIGRGELKKEAAAALQRITGYKFGVNQKVWRLWWKKYGDLFEIRRFLIDFRVIHAVDDYTELDKEHFSYFLEETRKADLTVGKPKLNAEHDIGRIIGEPAKYRGVLFSVKGKMIQSDEVREKNCWIATVKLTSYPFCQVICTDPPSAGKETVEFNAVFYKLRGDKNRGKPVVVFVGQSVKKAAGHSSEDNVEHLLSRCLDSDPAAAGKARKQLLKLGLKAVPGLLNAVDKDGDPVARATALLILAEIDRNKALTAAEKYLTSTVPLLQSCAEMVFKRILSEKNTSR